MTDKEKGTFAEKRRSIRVPAPKGATAIFRNEKDGLDRIQIRDLSLFGMLICDNTRGAAYPTDSVINNIYLNIRVGGLDNGTKYYIFIDKGKIVRSFVDEPAQSICYGIEFVYSSNYFSDQFKNLLNKLTPGSDHRL